VTVSLKGLFDSEEISWSVYPIETMIAEKLHALVSRRDFNSRSKDILDLSNFLPKADIQTLRSALQKTFQYRSTEVPKDLAGTLKEIDLTILEKGWANATASVANPPKFRESFEFILDDLRKRF
jgi:hypothetical protein